MTSKRPLRGTEQTRFVSRFRTIARALALCGGGLPVAIAVAVVVRLCGILTRPIWYDEAFAMLFARKGLAAMLVGTLSTTGAVAQRIFILSATIRLLWLWMRLFGESLVSTRGLSILAGLATIVVAYFLARSLFDRSTAFVSALLLALSPFQVHYSQEIRMYAFLGLWLTLATYCFRQAANTRDWRWWLGFAVSAALAMYTHNLAATYLFALALWPLLRGDWRTLSRVTLAGLAAVVLYLPWLVNAPAQLAKVRHAYSDRGADPLAPPDAAAGTRGESPGTAGIAGRRPLASLGSTALALLICMRSRKQQPQHRLQSSWMLYLSLAPPLLLFLVSQWTPVYLERALIASGVTLCIWLASALTSPSLGTPGRWILVSLIALGFGLGLWQHLSYRGFPYAPFELHHGRFAQAYGARRRDGALQQAVLTTQPVFRPGPPADVHCRSTRFPRGHAGTQHPGSPRGACGHRHAGRGRSTTRMVPAFRPIQPGVSPGRLPAPPAPHLADVELSPFRGTPVGGLDRIPLSSPGQD